MVAPVPFGVRLMGPWITEGASIEARANGSRPRWKNMASSGFRILSPNYSDNSTNCPPPLWTLTDFISCGFKGHMYKIMIACNCARGGEPGDETTAGL